MTLSKSQASRKFSKFQPGGETHCKRKASYPHGASQTTFSVKLPGPLSSEGKTRWVIYKGGKDDFYVAWVFALELKLSKTLSGLVYFVPYLHRGRSPPYNCHTKYTRPLRILTTSVPKQKPRLHKNYLSLLVNYPTCLTFRIVQGLGCPGSQGCPGAKISNILLLSMGGWRVRVCVIHSWRTQ